MAEDTDTDKGENSSQIYYILGAVILVVILGVGWFLRPKAAMQNGAPVASPVVPTPTPGPITSLVCDQQFYNPVVGFPQYFLSVSGGDVPSAKSVSCDFTISVGNTVVSSDSAKGVLTAAPERNGNTFRCTTKKVELTPDVPTLVEATIKDDLGVSTKCSATFSFPKP